MRNAFDLPAQQTARHRLRQLGEYVQQQQFSFRSYRVPDRVSHATFKMEVERKGRQYLRDLTPDEVVAISWTKSDGFAGLVYRNDHDYELIMELVTDPNLPLEYVEETPSRVMVTLKGYQR